MAANFWTAHLFLLFYQIVTVVTYQNVSVIELRIVETTVSQSNRRNSPTIRERLKQRDLTTQMSTCGYQDGDPSKSRTAEPDYDCRIDTANRLWGFCPTTVAFARDCGLAGACVDGAGCSGTCGFEDIMSISTIYCSETDLDKGFCSTAIIDAGEDQTFWYIACGAEETQIIYLPTPTIPITTTQLIAEPSSTGVTTEEDTVAESSSYSTDTTSNSDPEPTTTTSERPTTTTNTGAIVGGVLGGLALVCGTVVAVVYILRRSRTTQDRDEAHGEYTPQPQADKHITMDSGMSPAEVNGTALARDQIQSFELYSAPSSWRRDRGTVELGE
ncbi:hypothetical protein F4774DRAFT_427611 [Daldinia eschscholtzii]|nr:hypothetical protein F4774DRAFT_427611 [Daldinia eschscholtzii]